MIAQNYKFIQIQEHEIKQTPDRKKKVVLYICFILYEMSNN